MEFIFHFVFQKFNFVAWKIIEFLPRLSYSVNESLSEDAVREGDSLSIRTKARSDKTECSAGNALCKLKKAVFLLLFFCFGKKSKSRNNLGFHFLSLPQKTKQKNASAGKIQLPTFSLLLKFPKLVVVPPPQTVRNLNATSSCGFPV